MEHRSRWISGRSRVWVLLTALALLVTACGGADETSESDDGAANDAATEAADAGGSEEAADGGAAQVDLTGVSVTASTSQPGALLIPQFYAFDLMREWGADVEEVVLTNTPGIQALVAERTNLAPHGADELILGAAEGAEPVAVAPLVAKQEYVLAATGDVASVEDLEGATIGMSGPAGFDALLTRFALQDAGLDPDADVNFVQVGGSPDRAAAMLSGQVDAATIVIDDWFQLQSEADGAEIVLSMAEFVPDYPSSVYFGLAPFWADNPQAALGVACASLEANKWAQEDKQAFLDYGTELIEGADPAAIEELYDYAIEVGMYPTDPAEALSVDGMQSLMEAMVETGDISEPVDVETVIDTSYLEEAASMGCGQ
jgi:NitT/TauT family transport system substrate-binding protein